MVTLEGSLAKHYSPPASLETQNAQREKICSVMAVRIIAVHIGTRLETTFFVRPGTLLFVFLPLKGKQIEK